MTCPYCRIEVGGSLTKCPLCQSKLQGEPGEAYFPGQETLQKKSFIYKLQLFGVAVIIITGLGLDFMFGIRIGPFTELHWSLLLAMWLIVMEIEAIRQFTRGTGSSRKLTLSVFIILFMLTITSYYFGILSLTLNWIVPLTLVATMTANFVLAMLDKQGNTMVYLLTNLLVGALPLGAIYFWKGVTPVAWIICLLVSAILFVGAVIFKGRAVAKEMQRRLNV